MASSLESSVVRIYSKSRKVVGAGFLVSSKYVLTCAHVVMDALGLPRNTAEQPNAEIQLDFPLLAPGQLFTAKVIFWRPVNHNERIEDIAGLELVNSPPDSAKPALLVTSENLWEHTFRVLGFPAGQPDGVWASGVLSMKTGKGWVQLESVKQPGYRLEPGFSGAPVWDETLQGVVGIAVAAEMNRPELKVAFMISANVLIEAWPELGKQVIAACPYRGLLAFQEKDAEFFFGRETFVDGLVRVVQEKPLVAVIGSSGSGKSSVVLAGLIPKLREAGSWLIESFRPNQQPFYELAAALIGQMEPELGKTDQNIKAKELAQSIRQHGFTTEVSAILKDKPDKRLLLVVDQFEELYTRCGDTEQQQFVDALLVAVKEASHRLTLVLTLRADFYSYMVNYPPLGEALNNYPAQKNLSLMNAKEMEEAIELPAQKMGVKLEKGLTQGILKDVKQEPGNLPLLEFALTQLWKKQSQGLLTHQAYLEIGGVAKALSNHAEEVYRNLSPGEQKQAQRIFLQLVRPGGEGTENTRRVATRGQIENWNLVTRLADNRLLVTGRDEQTGNETVEVVHEALLKEWEQLRGWINDDRAFLVWQERLQQAMRQWEQHDKQEDYLLHGGLLVEAEETLKERQNEILLGRDFIEQSLALRKQKEDEKQGQELENLKNKAAFEIEKQKTEILDKANQEAKQKIEILDKANQEAKQKIEILDKANQEAKQKTEILNKANQEAKQKIKKANRRLAFGGAFLAISVVGLIIVGIRANIAIEERRAAIQATKLDQKVTPALQKVENAPIDGLVLAMESGIDLKDLVKDLPLEKYPTVSPLLVLQTILDNIEQQNQFETKQKGVNSVIFDDDSKQIVTAGEDGTVRQFDFYGKELLKIEAHKGGVRSVRFLLLDTAVPSVMRYTLETRFFQKTGFLCLLTVPHNSGNRCKNKFVTGGKDGTAKLWDISSPKQPQKIFKGHQCHPRDKKKCGVQNVRFPNNNDKILATSGDDGTLRLWDLQGKELSKIQAHQDSIESINFSPDDKLIATAGQDGVARLWQLNGNQINKTPVAEFKGHQGSVNSVFFSQKSKRLATVGNDGMVRLWDFQGTELQKFTAHLGIVKAVRFSPTDDQILATAGTDGTEGTVRLWSIHSKNDVKLLAEFKGHQGKIESIRFSKDGKTIVSAGADDGTVKIWTVPQKQFIQRLNGHQDSVNSVRFSPDGKLIATDGDDNKVILWTRNGEILQTFLHPSKVKSVRFSPKQNDKLLATAGKDGKVRLWDFDGNGQKKTEFDARQGIIESVNFSNDGNYLATAGEDKFVKLWTLKGDPQYAFNHASKVKSVRFSQNDKLLATVGENGSALLWASDNPKQPKAKLNGHQGTVYSVSFSPDGKEVSTAGDDGIIRRWDLNGKQLAEVKAYQTSLRNISFSKDGNLLATVGSGGTVKLWTSSGQQLAEFLGHQGIVNSVAFSDDGKWLATAGDDRTVILWPVRKLDQLLKEGCTRLKDYLSTQKDSQKLKSFCGFK